MGSAEKVTFDLTESLKKDILSDDGDKETGGVDYEVGYGDVNYWNVNENDSNWYQLEAELEKITVVKGQEQGFSEDEVTR